MGNVCSERVMAEPGPAPDHTSLQPCCDSNGGWAGVGVGWGTKALLPGQRSNPSPRLAWRCDKAHFPFHYSPSSPPFPSSSPCCQSCVVCFTLSRDTHVFARRVCLRRGCELSTQVKEMYKSESRGDKETHEESKSFAGSVEPETTKCTS